MTSANQPTTTIPLRLELEYMVDQRRLVRDLSFLTIASLHRRTDSDELLAFLGLSAPEVFSQRRARVRLNHLARGVVAQKIAELTLLLGKPVKLQSMDTVDTWVEQQSEVMRDTVEHWMASASALIARRSDAERDLIDEIRALAKSFSAQRESRASSAILTLNTEIIEEVARGGGSSHYRWTTQKDGRVRPNHVKLDDKIFEWDKPPSGGGTKPGDKGHPGSGYGCRCFPVPIQGGKPSRMPRRTGDVPREIPKPDPELVEIETGYGKNVSEYQRKQRESIKRMEKFEPEDYMKRAREPDKFIRSGASIDEAGETIRHNAFEHGAYFDDAGNLIARETSMSPYSIDTTDDVFANLQRKKRLRFVHNHPGGVSSPLSPSDFGAAAQMKMVEMRAVTSQGDTYIFRPIGSAADMAEDVVNKLWEKAGKYLGLDENGEPQYAIQKQMQRAWDRVRNKYKGTRLPIDYIYGRIVDEQNKIAREYGFEVVWQRAK